MAKFTALYELLGVPPGASAADIKKAYRRLAVATHPDRCSAKDATERFQKLQAVYEVLRDPERRACYDETGFTGDEDDGLPGKGCQSFDELKEFWKGLVEEVTEARLDAFFAQYRGSEEEKGDLAANFAQFGGDMKQVYAHQMCAEEGVDDARLLALLGGLIAEGRVEPTAAYRKWAKRVKKAEESGRRKGGRKAGGGGGGGGDMSALVAAIQSRGAAARAPAPGSVWAQVLAAGDEDPLADDAAFAAAQARLGGGRGGGGGATKSKGGVSKARKGAKKGKR